MTGFPKLSYRLHKRATAHLSGLLRFYGGFEEKHMDLFAPSHLLLLLLVILVIFGPSKLGDVGGALGKGIRDFKRAINESDNKAE